MVAKKQQDPTIAVGAVVDGLGESIDRQELRQVLLGVRELISQTRCQTLVHELRLAHDRIAEIKIADHVKLAPPSPCM